MPKIRDLIPSVFGGSKDKTKATNGKLETDALPVADDDNGNEQPETLESPTASAEMTENVVRELSDPNYNSMEVMPSTNFGAAADGSDGAVALPNAGPTMNTMMVHNAQQQVVMQFSNVNKLHLGSVYNFNSNITTGSTGKGSFTDEAAATTTDGKRQTPRKTVSIVAMMQSQEEPDHRMLDTIATHLGEGWKMVMRDLGHSEGQIEQACIDHQMHGGIKEVIYQLLLQWVRNADDGVASLGFITTLLWETNHRDCVQRMKLVWKTAARRKKSS